MKYALRFFQESQIKEAVDELIIKYTHKTVKLIDFVSNQPDNKRIVIDVCSCTKTDLEDSLNIFIAAKEKHKNIAILLSQYQKDILITLEEHMISFFFQEGVDTWDKLIFQMGCGVSDVYITNEFAFNIKLISQICHDKNIKVRIFPNVAQTSSKMKGNLNSFKFFFVRPEDIDLYEDFVDICEFFGPIAKQDILYKIYKDKTWKDQLSYLILGMDKEIDGNTIPPGWAERRLTCNKKCSYTGHCKICEYVLDLGAAMQENGYKFEDKEIDNEHTIIKGIMQTDNSSVNEGFV